MAIYVVAILASLFVIQFAARQIGLMNGRAGRIFVTLCMASTALAVYLMLVQRLERRLVSELAPQGAVRELLAGVALGLLLISGVMLALWIGGYVQVAWRGQVGAALLAGGALALGSATWEELLMRGVVFRILTDRLGWRVALAISALLFGGLHAFNPGATMAGCLAIAVEAGILLGAAFMYTRRLWLPIGLHLGWNFAEGSLYGAAVSGGTLPSLFVSRFTGPVLLTGGRFGPEASLAAVLVCGTAGVVLLRRALGRR